MFVITSTPKGTSSSPREENKGATVSPDNRPIKPMSDADYRRYFLPSNEECTSHRHDHHGAKHAAREQKVPECDIGSTVASAVNQRWKTKTDLGTAQKTAAGNSQKHFFFQNLIASIPDFFSSFFCKTVISLIILWGGQKHSLIPKKLPGSMNKKKHRASNSGNREECSEKPKRAAAMKISVVFLRGSQKHSLIPKKLPGSMNKKKHRASNSGNREECSEKPRRAAAMKVISYKEKDLIKKRNAD
ncbi:unnamed protein product [Gongylonema pulchrum]|uniref:DUF4005 domain-containing protein n=1 Tax=Gongylonema pulchrum TaxID=637853 RepID=A0A183E339_9BILA|nr:unnamed protein product [Gongylonema pulchrum]